MMQFWRHCQVLSEQTSDSSAVLNAASFKVCTQLWTEFLIFHISIRINCNRIGEGLLYVTVTTRQVILLTRKDGNSRRTANVCITDFYLNNMQNHAMRSLRKQQEIFVCSCWYNRSALTGRQVRRARWPAGTSKWLNFSVHVTLGISVLFVLLLFGSGHFVLSCHM
jgi:hypothetical protein